MDHIFRPCYKLALFGYVPIFGPLFQFTLLKESKISSDVQTERIRDLIFMCCNAFTLRYQTGAKTERFG